MSKQEQSESNSIVEMGDYQKTRSHKKPMQVLNQEKKMILKKYEHIFIGINLEDIRVLPILVNRNEIMRQIEQLYDKQVEEIIKQKTKYAIYLPSVLTKILKDKYKSNKNVYIQNLCNFVYSVHNYAQYPEIKLFLKFLKNKRENLQVLFYLYLRQHCKILLNLNFLTLHKNNITPLDIQMTKKQAQDIIKYAFYYDEIIQQRIEQHYNTIFKNQKQINYYEFLTQIASLEINFKDLNLMENLIALFRIKNKRDLLKIRFSEYASKYSDYSEVMRQQERRNNKRPKKTQKIDQIDEAENEDEEFSNQQFQEEQENFHQGEIKMQSGVKVQNQMQDEQVPQMVIGNPLDRTNLTDLKIDEIYKTIKGQYKKKISKQDLNLHKIIISELDGYCEKIIKSYIKQQQISLSDISDKKLIVKQKILKKLLFICLSLFFNSRKTFFNLLRKQIGVDKDTLDFWDELNSTYEQLKEFEIYDRTVSKTFLHKLFENDQISDQIMQYLKFQFKNDYDIVNYQVDFEFQKDEFDDQEDDSLYNQNF